MLLKRERKRLSDLKMLKTDIARELYNKYYFTLFEFAKDLKNSNVKEIAIKDGSVIITTRKENIFFHTSNLSHSFIPFKGMYVDYELSFLEDSRVQAVNVRPVYGKSKAKDNRIKSVEQALLSYANAYGLSLDIKPFIEDVMNGKRYIKEVGIHLRTIGSRQELLTCYFPRDFNFNEMLWAPVNHETRIEAVPVYTGEVTSQQRFRNIWRKFMEPAKDDYYLIENGSFRLRVHRSLAKEGVIDKYPAESGADYGYIRRNRRVYFRREWAGLNEIREGDIISFVPIISPKGYQARAIERV